MAQHALGQVSPSSTTTALRATNNQTDPTKPYACQAIQFQVLEANTGIIYICDRQTPTLTAHVHVALPAPVAGSTFAWSVGNPAGNNPLNAADYWILPAVTGEGVRITAVRT